MGYRERRAHKSQQKQQSLGQGYQPEQRVTLPAPTGANFRDDIHSLPDNEARYIDNAIPDEDGLLIGRSPVARAYLASVTTPSTIDLVAYEGTTSANNALFAFYGNKIFNVGEILDTSATATCSAISAPGMLSNVGGRYTQRNGTLIFMNGRLGPIKYTKASGWEAWDATVSGSRPMSGYNGITQFKSRLITWDTDWSGFAYSTADAVQGTFEFFDLAYVMGDEKTINITSMTRDGGSGPDDYFVIIGENGGVTVYSGIDPADSSWSLVGIYKVGKPLGHDCVVKYGSQIFVICEDDVYVLPDDLQGKRAHTKAAFDRRDKNTNKQAVGGVYWPEKDLILWSDATALSVKRGFAFTQVKTGWPSSGTPNNSLPAYTKPSENAGITRAKPIIYEGRCYAGGRGTSGNNTIYEILPSLQHSASADAPSYNAKIISKPIKLSGRTNISMVNPVFATRAAFTTAGDAPHVSNVVYRTAIVYDKEHKGLTESTASANAWITSSASSDSKGLWTPGFGTGDTAQIHIEVLSASTSADLLLKYIDITLSDTGGI